MRGLKPNLGYLLWLSLLLLMTACSSLSSTASSDSDFGDHTDALGLVYSRGVGQLIGVRCQNQRKLVTAAHVLDPRPDPDEIQASLAGRRCVVKLERLDRAGDYAELSSRQAFLALDLRANAKVSKNLSLLSRNAKGRLTKKPLQLILTGLNLPLSESPKGAQNLYLEDVCFASGVAHAGDSGGAILNDRGQLLGYLVGHAPELEFVVFRRLRADSWPPVQAPVELDLSRTAQWLTKGFVRAANNSRRPLTRSDFENLWRDLTEKFPEDQRIRRFWRLGLKTLLNRQRT